MATASLLTPSAARASATPAPVLLQIQILIQQHDLAAARTMALGAQQQHPNDGGLENLLGVIAAQQQDPTTAAQYFQQAIKHRPGLVQSYLNLARVYLESPGQFAHAEDKAALLYQQALKLDPASDDAHIQLASIFARRQQFAESLQQVNAVSPRQAGSLVATTLRCSAAAATGDRPQTDTAAASLLNDPNLQAADVMSMADGLRVGRRADLIEKLLRAAGSRQSLSPAALHLLGLAQDANGDAPGARLTLEQAFIADPQSTSILVDLAHIAAAHGDDEAALGYLAHARDLAPQNAALDFEFGQVCVRLKLLGEARNAMERAVAIVPENPEYNLELAKVTALSQDPLRALPYLLKYQALRPQDPNAPLLLGVIYYRVKDFDSATPWLRRAAAFPSTAADAHLYLGSGYRQLGDADRARQELEQSVKLDDRDAETHAELGLLALAAKDSPAATRELEHATALEPENYTANFGLLQLYAQTGDPRRKEQLARFEKIKEANDVLNRQAMRVIELNRAAPSP